MMYASMGRCSRDWNCWRTKDVIGTPRISKKRAQRIYLIITSKTSRLEKDYWLIISNLDILESRRTPLSGVSVLDIMWSSNKALDPFWRSLVCWWQILCSECLGFQLKVVTAHTYLTAISRNVCVLGIFIMKQLKGCGHGKSPDFPIIYASKGPFAYSCCIFRDARRGFNQTQPWLTIFNRVAPEAI